VTNARQTANPSARSPVVTRRVRRILYVLILIVVIAATAVIVVSIAAPGDAVESLQEQELVFRALPDAVQQRLCAHRINSLERFEQAASIFNCLEIDVMLHGDGSQAFAYHPHVTPPEPRDQPLAPLLSRGSELDKRLWLDMKNLSEENVDGFLTLLSKHASAFDEGDLMVEVQAKNAGTPTLTKLREHRILISYYLPTEEAARCSSITPPDDACDDFRERVVADLTRDEFDVLSFDYTSSLPFVRALPVRPLLAAWALDTDLTSYQPSEDILDYQMFIIKFAVPQSATHWKQRLERRWQQLLTRL
jgi:hypothetical protein